uniref:Uncharacterized protein n=1 Tax=Fibrocapsa japonica TaxID=94617 RepID=A0A7S2XUB6_9STRA
MLTKLGPHQFCFMRPNSSPVRYNVGSLVDYMLSTGNFVEPESRIPFSDEDLKRLDLQVAQAGLARPSVFHAKYHAARRFEEQLFKQDALTGLERLLGQVVADMLHCVEECGSGIAPSGRTSRGPLAVRGVRGSSRGAAGSRVPGGPTRSVPGWRQRLLSLTAQDQNQRHHHMLAFLPPQEEPSPPAAAGLELGQGDRDKGGMDPDEAQVLLATQHFPAFSDLWHQIKNEDVEFSQHCLQHYRTYLSGPPNKPTKDCGDLLNIIFAFFDEIEKGKVRPQDFGFI